MAARLSLEDEVSRAFKRACRERDWQVAEFLFQALEAIAEREGDEGRMESAFSELLPGGHRLGVGAVRVVRGRRPAR